MRTGGTSRSNKKTAKGKQHVPRVPEKSGNAVK